MSEEQAISVAPPRTVHRGSPQGHPAFHRGGRPARHHGHDREIYLGAAVDAPDRVGPLCRATDRNGAHHRASRTSQLHPQPRAGPACHARVAHVRVQFRIHAGAALSAADGSEHGRLRRAGPAHGAHLSDPWRKGRARALDRRDWWICRRRDRAAGRERVVPLRRAAAGRDGGRRRLLSRADADRRARRRPGHLDLFSRHDRRSIDERGGPVLLERNPTRSAGRCCL